MFVGIIKKAKYNEQACAIADRIREVIPNAHEECTIGNYIGFFRMDDNAQFFSCMEGIIILEGVLYNCSDICEKLNIPADSKAPYIILCAYRKWGERFLLHIDGKFSFVLVDHVSDLIIAAIDRFGEQKLCYGHFEDEIAFSTSSKLLVRLQNKREINPDALAMYFAHNYISAPYTIYKEIFKVSPGSYIIISKCFKMSISKYWKVYDCLKEKVKMKVTIEEAQKEIVNVLKNNIRKRWTAKNFQTAALLLSGGIDSAILCSVISEMKDIPLIAYTASFKKAGQNYDESDMARVVAENCGVKHEVIEIDFDVLCNHIYEILGATDEPMANRTYLAVAMLINVASENCDCIFTGDGGDEIFLGYPQYQRLCKAQNIYLSLYPFRKLLLSNIVRKFIPRKLITIMECSNMDSPEQMFSVNAVKNAKKAVLDVKDSLFYSAPWEKYKEWCIQKNLLDLYYGTQAPLRKWNDIASENKLIHYAPLLDSSVIMKASLFPRKYKMQGKNNKVVLRNIINNRIPAVGKLPKHGFNVPIDEWMRGPLRDTFEDVTSESFIKKQGLFRVEEIIRLKQIFLEGKSDYQNDAVTFMWNYFVFQVWYREAMGK